MQHELAWARGLTISLSMSRRIKPHCGFLWFRYSQETRRTSKQVASHQNPHVSSCAHLVGRQQASQAAGKAAIVVVEHRGRLQASATPRVKQQLLDGGPLPGVCTHRHTLQRVFKLVQVGQGCQTQITPQALQSVQTTAVRLSPGWSMLLIRSWQTSEMPMGSW